MGVIGVPIRSPHRHQWLACRYVIQIVSRLMDGWMDGWMDRWMDGGLCPRNAVEWMMMLMLMLMLMIDDDDVDVDDLDWLVIDC